MNGLVDSFRKVAADLSQSAASAEMAHTLSLNIAEALSWTEGTASVQSVQIDAGTVQVVRGLIGPQPAAIFAVTTEATNGSLLNETALYAYHATIPWGLVANREGALIFNSHWVRKNDWFYLPFIRWDSLEENVDVLSSITPSGVAKGAIEKVATKVYEPDRFLLPVDDALVERLDFWRAETLRFSRDVVNVDEKLQTLFAQLFVLRSVENRNIAPTLPTLRSISSVSNDVDVSRLRKLLKDAQAIIGSELFEVDTLAEIPSNVLGGIINDLYIPYELPYRAGRYNFAWIDADVLGLAYEKYLSTIIAPTTAPMQLRLFDQPIREVERISVRKSTGVYYTPNYRIPSILLG